MAKATLGKVVVGMSGGVDSSVALLNLKKQGYEPVGVSLKYSVWDNKCNFKENVCCSAKSFKVAEDICKQLKVPYYKVNVEKEFKEVVIDYFVEELKSNRTPSPCVFCNYNLKFKVLLLFARQIKANFVATGHYARIKHLKNGQVELLKARDETKDQTYSLSFLPQNYLKHIIFPLGELTKDEVYKIAKGEKGFEVFEKTKQSQDFCFVSGRAMPEFLRKEVGINRGKVIDEKGLVLGEHQGLHFYTIGQRKGINLPGGRRPEGALPGGPYYVVDKVSKTNELVVGKEQKQTERIKLSYCHFVSKNKPDKEITVMAKVRSAQPIVAAKLFPINLEKSEYCLVFDKPQSSVTAGQVAVFYQGEICLGGGVIRGYC